MVIRLSNLKFVILICVVLVFWLGAVSTIEGQDTTWLLFGTPLVILLGAALHRRVNCRIDRTQHVVEICTRRVWGNKATVITMGKVHSICLEYVPTHRSGHYHIAFKCENATIRFGPDGAPNVLSSAAPYELEQLRNEVAEFVLGSTDYR